MNANVKKFPYKVKPLEEKIHSQLLREFRESEGFVQIGDEKVLMPASFERTVEEFYNFQARSDDVWVCTLPRSGTTWTQEMVWLICNELDYKTAKEVPLMQRFPFIELHTLVPGAVLLEAKGKLGPYYDSLAAQTSRRFIKTHLPIKMLPRNLMKVGAKVVYVARNPKDVAVSFFHFEPLFSADFKTFAEYFLNDLVVYNPYWAHVLGGWKNRHWENVHFMFYEDLKQDLEGSLKKLADFLEKPLKAKDLAKLLDHLQFDRMKENPSVNIIKNQVIHMRRGQVGGNPEMTEEISKKFDRWTEENLRDSDFEFPSIASTNDEPIKIV